MGDAIGVDQRESSRSEFQNALSYPARQPRALTHGVGRHAVARRLIAPVSRLEVDRAGTVRAAAQLPSPNCDDRPPGTEITLLVVHNISLPPGEFGGNAIAELFTNRLDPSAHPYFATIRQLRVSAHFLIGRDGTLTQFVSCERRAWHAGASSWRGQGQCNDFSLGVE